MAKLAHHRVIVFLQENKTTDAVIPFYSFLAKLRSATCGALQVMTSTPRM